MTLPLRCAASSAALRLELGAAFRRFGAAGPVDARAASAHLLGILLLRLYGARIADGGRTGLVAARDHDGDIARADRRGLVGAAGSQRDGSRPRPADIALRQPARGGDVYSVGCTETGGRRVGE